MQSISYIVSPAVAALLYSVWELNAIIAIDVLGAVIASITVAIVRIPKLGDQVQSLKPNFIREMKEGMAVLRQNKGLFALLLVGTLYMFVYMPINALYPLITMEYFNGTPMHISITEIAYASGMLIGGLLLGLFGNYLNLWSRTDPTEMRRKIREAMYAAGFGMVEESDKGYNQPAYDTATSQFTVQWTWCLRGLV